MVIQGRGNPTPDVFPDNAPQPEQDPYSYWSSPTNPRIDPDLVPRPFPVFGIPLGFSTSAIQFRTEIALRLADQQLKRTLNHEESQALALHLYTMEQTKSYYAVAGSAIGTWRWYTTWNTMRYPFYQPKLENIDPNKFAMIRGPMALVARQTFRFSLYFLTAGWMGSFLGQLIAQPIATVRISQDPKLERFAKEVHSSLQEELKGKAELIEKRREAWKQGVDRREERPLSPVAKVQAPSAEKSENDAWSSSTTAESWESFSNDTSQQGSRQQQNPRPSRSWGNRPPPRQSVTSPSSPLDDNDDNASPTGGLFQEEVLNSQSQAQSRSRPGESAWDRLRRGNAPPQLYRPPQSKSGRPGQEPKEPGDNSMVEDPFNVSDDEEESKRARERAQKEFDARVERERQGRDFDNEENKKW